MENVLVCMVSVSLMVLSGLNAHAEEVDASKNWGIGLQGNYPLIGGLSVRYYGLSPVYLQVVGRLYMDGLERDNMLGGGLLYAVYEHIGDTTARLYFGVEGGERYEKKEEYSWDEERDLIYTTKTYGIGVVFGVEFAVPFMGIYIGCNAEIGQGYGRVDEEPKAKDIAAPIFGGGIHVYF